MLRNSISQAMRRAAASTSSLTTTGGGLFPLLKPSTLCPALRTHASKAHGLFASHLTWGAVGAFACATLGSLGEPGLMKQASLGTISPLLIFACATLGGLGACGCRPT